MLAVRTAPGQAWPALLALAAAVLLYWPALDYGFLFDDRSLISADGWPVALGPGLPYRPLRYASYALDALLGGSPLVYHLHNVLLHGLVAALSALVAGRLGAAAPAAAAAGLLVAVHPLSVEAAAYVSGRRDLLCAAAGLGALLGLLHGRSRVALLLLFLSVASKESGLVFAAPMLLAWLGRLGPAAGAGPDAERGFGTGLAVASLAGLALMVAYGATGPWLPASGFEAAARAGLVALHYVAGLLLLRDLGPEYPELASASLPAGVPPLAAIAVAALLVVALAATGIALRRRAAKGDRPVGLFAAGWMLAVLVAMAVWGGLHEPGVDRHAYLALPALAACLALAWPRSAQRSARAPRLVWRPAVAAALALLVLSSLAGATRAQMGIWSSEAALWRHAAFRPGASARAHTNLARVLATDGRYGAAVRQLHRALALSPGDPDLHVGRAALRCAQGRMVLARQDITRASRLGAPAELLDGFDGECAAAAAEAAARRVGGVLPRRAKVVAEVSVP